MGDPQAEFDRWMTMPQRWVRDRAEPAIALGQRGAFDDMHIFAQCVAHASGRYQMWYVGSQGGVVDRVYRVGLGTGSDGIA